MVGSTDMQRVAEKEITLGVLTKWDVDAWGKCNVSSAKASLSSNDDWTNDREK